MSDKMFDPYSDEELSIDDLISQAKEQSESAPGMAFVQPEETPVYEPQSVPQPADDFSEEFMPDFGDAFDDYGVYDEPSVHLPQMGSYEAGGYEDPEDEELSYEPYDSEEDDAPPPKKPKRKHRRRFIPLFVKVLLYLVLVGVAAVGLGYGAWECAQDVLAFGRSDDTLSVTIKQGDTVEDIARMLQEKGVIKYPWLFKFYCNFTDSNDTMDPGTYEISYNFDYHALVEGMIANSPNRTTVRVMIPEGMTLSQLCALMEKNKVCSAADLMACAAETKFDYWFLEEIPYGEATRLEGFLFPDTYDFYESDDPERVLDKLLSNFNKKFSEQAQEQLELLNEQLAQRWADGGYDESYIASHKLSIRDLITVASMIEKETADASESGNIASVIYNRLCNPGSFPCLQIDATVVYALGGIDHPLTYEDTQVDSPYNTYIVQGLPAGPISNPGLSSITAALNPQDTDYFYYALDNSTGFHHFSETYDEHNQFLQEQNSNED